jgi:hypothetical protein
MFVEHKEAVEITEAPAKTLRLSECIRIGAKMKPQGFESYDFQGRTCAIGAAMDAIGGNLSVLLDMVGRSAFWHMHDQIVWKNDYERWTREQIADWLESQGY